MPRAVAINVGANTNEPGFRGPIYPDGSFSFVPIPESKPAEGAPTYADLALEIDMPTEVANVPVHLDPEFAEYPHCETYTYGDPFGVKARPLLDLERGDFVLFYATLSCHDGSRAADWITPDWGAYVIGQFRLARNPIDGDSFAALDRRTHEQFSNNAHVKREEFDAAVMALGDPEGSGLYDTALPLSSPERGVEANWIVTDLSRDSGKGPWWRRPMRFDADATRELRALRESGAYG